MDFTKLPEILETHGDLLIDLEVIQQNDLLRPSAFLAFVRDRGLDKYGVCQTDIDDFAARGWLRTDNYSADGARLFHPFRIYPLFRILQIFAPPRMSPSILLQSKDRLQKLLEVTHSSPDLGLLADHAEGCNRTVDLAILCEPVYWPAIAGGPKRSLFVGENAFRDCMREHGEKVRSLVLGLEPAIWQDAHEFIRHQAASLDDNSELYLLLRLSNWKQRQQQKHAIAGALWLRHAAEVIRRAFENTHKVLWQEEDIAFDYWPPGSRRVAYGTERPLDDPVQAIPSLATRFGISTGSSVRWYVEGDTEYFAILEFLGDPATAGIELYNLKGALKSGRDNAALKLEDMLEKDRSLARFSVIAFDRDVAANVRAIRRQVELGNVVGFVTGHDPDFEFDNFGIHELSEIAAGIDEAHGHPAESVRNADWKSIGTARAFESAYTKASGRKPRALKGEEWGRALAAFAKEHPARLDGAERPLIRDLKSVLRARSTHYAYQRDNYEIDPETLILRRRITDGSG